MSRRTIIPVYEFLHRYSKHRSCSFGRAVQKMAFGVVQKFMNDSDHVDLLPEKRIAKLMSMEVKALLSAGWEVFINTDLSTSQTIREELRLQPQDTIVAMELISPDLQIVWYPLTPTIMFARQYVFSKANMSEQPSSFVVSNGRPLSQSNSVSFLGGLERLQIQPVQIRRGPIDPGQNNMLVYCHNRPVQTHFGIEDLRRFATDAHVSETNMYTLDVSGEADIVANGFARNFLTAYPSAFDVVVLPDCGGPWFGATGSDNTVSETCRRVLVEKIITNVLTIVKPGGKMIVSKLYDIHKSVIREVFGAQVSNESFFSCEAFSIRKT